MERVIDADTVGAAKLVFKALNPRSLTKPSREPNR